MSISGHKDKRTFYSYILLSGEEVAEENMRKKPKKENSRESLNRKRRQKSL